MPPPPPVDVNHHTSKDARRSSTFALGVDAGGSKTHAVVVDAEGQERGHGLSPGANYVAIGLERALQNIRAAVEQAIQAAHCHLPLHGAWFGLAGVDRPTDYNILFPYLQLFAETVRVTNDAELLLSPLPDAMGIVLIAGTGSIALGRDHQGTLARAGGWGHIIGDEGSGYDIGRQAAQAAVRASDGRGPRTLLLDLIMRQWNLERSDDIIDRVYTRNDKADIARLSSCVFQAAHKGDEVARTIVQNAASELALTVKAVSEKLDFPDGHVPLALGGGLLLHEAELRAQVLQRLRDFQVLKEVVLVEQPALSAARAMLQ